MGRKDRNLLAGWLAASMGYVDKPLARVSRWCGWVSVSVSVSFAVFFILFSTKFYLNWKSVPTCAWHLIFCWPTGSAQCPPIHDTGYSLLSKNPCPPVHDTWFLIYRLGKPSVHLYMTLSLYPPWAKKPVPSCAWHLVFLLNNWASPVPTYTWHWLTLFDSFFFWKTVPACAWHLVLS